MAQTFYTPGRVRAFLIVLAVGLAVYVLGPPLYWRLTGVPVGTLACPPCVCKCTGQDLPTLPPIKDCGKNDAAMREELDKSVMQLLREELELQATVAEEAQQRLELAFLDAKSVANTYQKEAEKCNKGMETSEEEREKAEAALAKEKKLTAKWERRARQSGWQDSDESNEEDREPNEGGARGFKKVN
eukprot:TRINITY_DN14901_c0_g1_i1.p1 TRINITY_DN14901_c0_g1~~TRINITY_DN14901_c0_g1_i1.p1  ORF type:complete len:187 (-),score=38.22 TRINITY_DN14901_c0_g1_i1:873-1433(-)